MDATPTDLPRSARAGRYVRQPTGYRAFLPARLPPSPPIQIDGDFARLLSEADRAFVELVK